MDFLGLMGPPGPHPLERVSGGSAPSDRTLLHGAAPSLAPPWTPAGLPVPGSRQAVGGLGQLESHVALWPRGVEVATATGPGSCRLAYPKNQPDRWAETAP